MEQYKTKNKILNSIIKPVVIKLQNAKFNVDPETFASLPTDINNTRRTIRDNIFPNVNLFFSYYDDLKNVKNLQQRDWRIFLNKLNKALIEIDYIKIKTLTNSIENCKFQLGILDNTVNSKRILPWFKVFCTNICTCISLIHERTKEATSENITNNLFLYIVQLSTSLKLFFRLFKEEFFNKLLIAETRRFLKKRFIYIFDGINKILDDNDCAEINPGFIQWMDTALDLISELNANKNSNIDNIKIAVNELLCHAMSIAQICSKEDNQKLSAGVQTVLHEFKQLETEFNKTNIDVSVRNLYIDIVTDKLYMLERRVNTAVLNISLNVFSNPLQPLKKLQTKCEESNVSILQRSENDLDVLVQNFDSHVDCMIQVGLFAIACSTNTKIIAKIRSYLASLESLECELIPALTSLYMEPSKCSSIYANIFIKYWCEEVKSLKKDVCFIIDPVALGQVVYEHYKTNLEMIQDEIHEDLTQKSVNSVCKNIKMLILVAEASLNDMKITKDSNIYKNVENLKNVYREVLAASELLSDKKYIEKVIKRLLILSKMIERVIVSFSDENTNCTSLSVSNLLHSAKQTNENKIKRINLKDYEKRGLKILKDRSVLYKTPNKKNLKLLTTPRNISMKTQENRKLGISFIRKNILTGCDLEDENNTLDLQITEILEDLTNLAHTLK